MRRDREGRDLADVYAVAVAIALGPAAGLAIANALVTEPSLERYHLLPSVRADLLAKLGRHEEARMEFERAAALTQNTRERELLLGRARVWGGGRRSRWRGVSRNGGGAGHRAA